MPILCVHLLLQVLTITEEEVKSGAGLQSSPAALERMAKDLQLLLRTQSPANKLLPANRHMLSQHAMNPCLTSSSPKPHDDMQVENALTRPVVLQNC